MARHLSVRNDYSAFDQIMAPYYQDIKKYCFSLTTTKWDAEDLLQDTLLKLYLALKKDPHKEITKRFLYRIAQNTWLDEKRKKRIDTKSLDEQSECLANIGQQSYQFQIRKALEILADYLSIKQFVIVLLMDVFQFTAKETAEMIRDSETNVYASLHRSRKKLNRYFNSSFDPNRVYKKIKQSTENNMSDNLFETFMNGFQTRNAKLIYEAYLSIAKGGVQIDKVSTDGYSLCFQFTDPDGNVLMICNQPA